MKGKNRGYSEGRRSFFRNMLFLGGGAAAFAVTRKSAGSVQGGQKPVQDRNIGYHLTPHIKKYYKTAGV